MPVPARDLRLFIGQGAQKAAAGRQDERRQQPGHHEAAPPASSCNLTVLTRGHG
jgi:hypothetical protein